VPIVLSIPALSPEFGGGVVGWVAIVAVVALATRPTGRLVRNSGD
jgi:hypothetical protein